MQSKFEIEKSQKNKHKMNFLKEKEKNNIKIIFMQPLHIFLLVLHICTLNIRQENYYKIYLNNVNCSYIYIFLNKYITLYFAVVSSHVFLKTFSFACVMNITQKLYDKIHLNDVLALLLLNASSLPHVQRFFSRMKQTKT